MLKRVPMKCNWRSLLAKHTKRASFFLHMTGMVWRRAQQRERLKANLSKTAYIEFRVHGAALIFPSIYVTLSHKNAMSCERAARAHQDELECLQGSLFHTVLSESVNIMLIASICLTRNQVHCRQIAIRTMPTGRHRCRLCCLLLPATFKLHITCRGEGGRIEADRRPNEGIWDKSRRQPSSILYAFTIRICYVHAAPTNRVAR
jgi:hypothetical protein